MHELINHNLGHAYFYIGKYDESLKYLNKAIEIL